MSIYKLVCGDSAKVLKTLKANSFDSLVTDPPAGISFMGREWDSDKGGRDKWINWLSDIMAQAKRVMKPGAHGLIWCYNRTQHWTMFALENAGFEIRDVIYHAHGQGFPKAKRIDGEATLIRPAMEPWILVRKRPEGSIEANYRKWGTGLLNISTCKINRTPYGTPLDDPETGDTAWPTNMVMSHIIGCERLSDVVVKTAYYAGGTARDNKVYSADNRIRPAAGFGGEDGLEVAEHWSCADGCPVDLLEKQKPGASRLYNVFAPEQWDPFFYNRKSSKGDKNDGLEDFEIIPAGVATGGRKEGSAGLKSPRAGSGHAGNNRNSHPTVKPIGFMRWAVRLVTPRGGSVLDTFTGSGSTGVGACPQGFKFYGIEMNPEFIKIADARIKHWLTVDGATPEVAERIAASGMTRPIQTSLMQEGV